MQKLFYLAFIVSSLFACKSDTNSSFDLANAKKEIEASNRVITDYFAKGDSVSIASAYSKDGALMVNNMPSIKGKENLIKAWGSFINTGMSNIELNTLDVWGNKDYLTEEGLFIIKSKDGVQMDKGKYLVLWKREDGKWKLYRDMSNSDLPLSKK